MRTKVGDYVDKEIEKSRHEPQEEPKSNDTPEPTASKVRTAHVHDDSYLTQSPSHRKRPQYKRHPTMPPLTRNTIPISSPAGR